MAVSVNPGGQLAPDQVLGRDRFIAQFWEAIEVQSVVLSAERRMGKTCVVKKMEAQPRSGFLPLYRDLEGVSTPLEFATRVAQDVMPIVRTRARAGMRVAALMERLAGAELGVGQLTLKIPEHHSAQWKVLLESAIADTMEANEGRLVFFWDEVPLMLQTILRVQGPAVAMDVLDALRSLRQTHDRVRMVFTGSIGLHGVLARLRQAGHANAPVNDMRWLDLPALTPEAAVDLAAQLLVSIGHRDGAAAAIASDIARAVDGIPFYIHQTVAAMRDSGCPLTAVAVTSIIREQVVAAQDPWGLAYYRTRLDQHYSDRELELALAVLDAASRVAPPGLRLVTLLKQCMHDVPRCTKEEVRAVVSLLEKDHYLVRSNEGHVGFQWGLIREWWSIHREG